jgi:hypothetical protein
MAPLILWAGFLMSHLVLAGVAWFARPPALDPNAGPVLAVLTAVAVACAVAGLLVVPRVAGSAPAVTRFLLRLACLEAVGCVALVMAFLGGAPDWFAPLQVVGLLGHLSLLPREDRRGP